MERAVHKLGQETDNASFPAARPSAGILRINYKKKSELRLSFVFVTNSEQLVDCVHKNVI